MGKIRLDQLLLEKGLFLDLKTAQARIMSGDIIVNEHRADKASDKFLPDVNIRVRGKGHEFVSRGGLKLEHAIATWGGQIKDATCIDVGASTGGFTEVLLKNGAKDKMTVYTRSDACGAADAWAKYLGNKKQDDLEGVGVFGDPGIAKAVISDKFGIGYNNVAYAYDFKTKKPNPGIAIVPIDVNENGKLDPEENFYSTSDKLNMAILAGKYPSPPARQLYFVSNGTITDNVTLAFLKWVLTDGQKYVAESGFVELPTEVINEQIAKLPK